MVRDHFGPRKMASSFQAREARSSSLLGPRRYTAPSHHITSDFYKRMRRTQTSKRLNYTPLSGLHSTLSEISKNNGLSGSQSFAKLEAKFHRDPRHRLEESSLFDGYLFAEIAQPRFEH